MKATACKATKKLIKRLRQIKPKYVHVRVCIEFVVVQKNHPCHGNVIHLPYIERLENYKENRVNPEKIFKKLDKILKIRSQNANVVIHNIFGINQAAYNELKQQQIDDYLKINEN